MTIGIKQRIKAHPQLKKIAEWLLHAPNDYRPRWWIRAFVNPFVHRVSSKAIIRWSARLDVFPYQRFEIGKNSLIESHVVIAASVGDVIIGEKVLVGIGSKIIGPVNMGNHILIAQNVLMSGMNHDFQDVSKPIVNQGFNTAQITIEDGAWIGAGSIIVAGVTIGQNAVVGAGAVVTKSIPPYCVAVGNPAKVVKKYNFETQQWETTAP